MYLLFPGRHLIHTAFQDKYLRDVYSKTISELGFKGGDEVITQCIYAVTSANQDHSRYNPLPLHIRAVGVDRFARDHSVPYALFGIPHYGRVENFASYIVREIEVQSDGEFTLTPENTIVISSTPSIISMFESLGYRVITAEYDTTSKKYIADTPTGIIEQFVQQGLESTKEAMADTTYTFWKEHPSIPATVMRLWNDPLLTETGDLTETRNYSTYAIGMAHESLLDIKYADVADAIKEGKIVDEGCADGALLTKISKDFPDSDLIGVEITSEFIARAGERQRAGEFGNAFIHFHQRNIMQPIFVNDSIDTTICNSTTHELYSYAGGVAALQKYLSYKYNQTRRGGRIIIRDVVGPDNGDQEVYMLLRSDDGSNDNVHAEYNSSDQLKTHLDDLSTHARFIRFASDYVRPINYTEETINGATYIKLSFRDATEFITKKDYTENWSSELHEEFAFWAFSDWQRELKSAGFTVLEGETLSRTYTNDWIVENRYKPCVQFFQKHNEVLEEMQYPPTNVVMVAEK